jgi:hypothetical protein
VEKVRRQAVDRLIERRHQDFQFATRNAVDGESSVRARVSSATIARARSASNYTRNLLISPEALRYKRFRFRCQQSILLPYEPSTAVTIENTSYAIIFTTDCIVR